MASPGAAIAPAFTDTFTFGTNASAWANFTSTWTRYAPSLEDLILAGPRMLTRIGSIISFPEAIDSFGQRVIPDPTGSDYFVTTTATEMATEIAADITEAVANTANVLEDDQDPAALMSRFTVESSAKGLGSVFSYATSKWALCCVAMAIVLNRTHIFAASRRRLRLTWPLRLFLRFAPILLFAYQARRLLQAIQCQTSPDFAEMRWGSSNKTSELMFAEPSGYLHGLSSTLLLGSSDYDSCRAVNMIPASNQDFSNELRGSLSQLWPLFQTLCLSHFIETVSCAVQGRPVAVETGMTLFEHSLAFAEADAAIGNQLGWGLFSSGNTANTTFQQASGANIAISRSMIMNRVNTPPEVLLIAFISSMSHITSHILGIFGLQNRYRLISTGFWAVCFMGSLAVEVLNFSIDGDFSHMGLFRFPTVCIIGFIPHILVFAGILVCFAIYVFALALAAMEPPEPTMEGRPLTFRERIHRAHENMQANISLADIRISRGMDFYTALLRTGFGVITMASEAVYLNEDRNVNIKERTWLEEERFRELESLHMHWAGPGGTGGSSYNSIGTMGLVPIKDGQPGVSSGYARERAAQKVPKSRVGDRRPRDGVGAAERSSRWLLALEFLLSISRLVLRWSAFIVLKGLSRIGIRQQPGFLLYLSRWPARSKDEKQPKEPPKTRSRLSRNRDGFLYNDETADVEAEVRRRLQRSPETIDLPEEELDSRLYDSWKYGELWGAVDTSGNWNPNEESEEWDATSVITSLSENEATTDDQWEDDDDEAEVEAEGQKTPTQNSFAFSRETTPLDQLISMPDLARLLHPRSPEERHEAHALAAHLNSDRIITRSQYARMQQNQRGRLLLSSRSGRRHPNQGRMTDEEQADLLEELILSRRAEVQGNEEDKGTRHGDDDDERAEPGPPCVVCQVSPRKIIVWPCRCLSLCDECRVSLAMNNFDKCVCCRREVISFSRIYVP